jgi:hypothetical protein
MLRSTTRRSFLRTSATAGALAGLGDLGFLSRLNPVSAAETKLDAKHVQLDASIEPVVRMIEETPRNRLLEVVAGEVKRGLSYREVLAGLMLAGVKNIEPRPSVGFKFHAVLVVNSAHLASESSPPEHRWLPIFWALDQYKSSAARDVEERGDWVMSGVKESDVPPAHKAPQAFAQAMDKWDEAAADAAVAGLARSAGMNEVYETLFRYGARDFRSIGHKAIYVANSCRTLHCIGWQHAEPVLRSLAYALLNNEGSGNPAQNNFEADRPYRRNEELARKVRAEWRDGAIDAGATEELLQVFRRGTNDEACDLVVDLLNRGVSPQSVWDGMHLAAGEMLMQQPGIVSLHTLTTTNALHYAYQASGNDETRRLMMLQNAAFLPMFRAAMRGRGQVKDVTINDLPPAEVSVSQGDAAASAAAVDRIFAELSRDATSAAGQALGFLQQTHDARTLIDAARVLVFLKGSDSHDYKFSSAVLEDYYHVSPAWRDRFLALSMFKLLGSGARDNGLVQRTRAALA